MYKFNTTTSISIVKTTVFAILLASSSSVNAYSKDNKSINPNATISAWKGVNVKGKVCIDSGNNVVDVWFINSGTTWPSKSVSGEYCSDLRNSINPVLRVRNKSANKINIKVWDVIEGRGLTGAIIGTADGLLGGKNSEPRKILRALDPSNWKL